MENKLSERSRKALLDRIDRSVYSFSYRDPYVQLFPFVLVGAVFILGSIFTAKYLKITWLAVLLLLLGLFLITIVVINIYVMFFKRVWGWLKGVAEKIKVWRLTRGNRKDVEAGED
jgi:energy-coupling factor transporter transmembrane protein EcfT